MNVSSLRADRLERLRRLCLALPGATEKRAWGDPSWRVEDRIFAMQKGNFAGGRPSVWMKAAPGDQAVLLDLDPERVFVPPYVGHRGWVGVHLDSRSVDWELLARLVAQSHALVAGVRRTPRASSRSRRSVRRRRSPRRR
jgi:predicted DNA-binding protein (MmcQ/YjbR family)